MGYVWSKNLKRPSKALDTPIAGKLSTGKHTVQIEDIDLTQLPTVGQVIITVRNSRHETLQLREFVADYKDRNLLSFPIRSLIAAVAYDPIDLYLLVKEDPRLLSLLSKTRFGVIIGYSNGGKIETTSDGKFIISMEGNQTVDKEFNTQRAAYYYMKDNNIPIAHRKVLSYHRVEKHEQYNEDKLRETVKAVIKARRI